MASLMRLVSETMPPRPSPGKMKTLLAWPIRRPSTGGKGLPVAMSARPSVQRTMSSGVASAMAVGFESGITIGRSVPDAISRTTSSEKVPATPVVPTRIVGRYRRIVVTRSSSTLSPSAIAASRGTAMGRFVSSRPVAVGVHQAARVGEQHGSRDRLHRHSHIGHLGAQQSSDADPRGTGADQQDPLRRHRSPEVAQGGEHAGQHDRRRALHVVVERRHPIPVPVEDAEGVVLLEVLPLDDAARPGLLHARHEGVDQRVVLGAAQPRLPMPDVERIGEELRVVGADVQADRKGEAGVDAAGARVERQLADRDGHPAGAEVTEPEDAFVVGHHDEPDVGVRAVAQDLRDPVAIVRRDPGAARAPEDVAELLAGAPDGRGVHDRQQLLQVLGQDPIEERRVPVLERGEADVLLERIVLPAQPLQLEGDLLLDGHDVVRQQAAQAERVALVRREGEVLGEQPVGEERRAAERDLRRASGGDRVVRRWQRAHRASRIRNRTWPPFAHPVA